jgi:hypothetical protein
VGSKVYLSFVAAELASEKPLLVVNLYVVIPHVQSGKKKTTTHLFQFQ